MKEVKEMLPFDDNSTGIFAAFSWWTHEHVAWKKSLQKFQKLSTNTFQQTSLSDVQILLLNDTLHKILQKALLLTLLKGICLVAKRAPKQWKWDQNQFQASDIMEHPNFKSFW